MLLLHSSRPHYNIRILSVVPTAVNLHVIIRQLLKKRQKTSKTEKFLKKEKNLLKDSEISPLPYCPLLIYMLYLKNRILY